MTHYELLIRVLCDTRPEVVADGAFLFSQTENNQESVFLAARELLENSVARTILFINTPAKSGYPGYTVWKRELEELGISEDQIEGVNAADTATLNTLIESEALVRFAKLRGYERLIVVSSPFHQLRALMTAVTVALREYPDLQIHSQPGPALPWLQTAVHSQGTLESSRNKLIWSEIERIEKYQKKGDLGSFDEALKYLNMRDARS